MSTEEMLIDLFLYTAILVVLIVLASGFVNVASQLLVSENETIILEVQIFAHMSSVFFWVSLLRLLYLFSKHNFH